MPGTGCWCMRSRRSARPDLRPVRDRDVMAQKLSGHLLQELVVRGSCGGPLFPLASQLNTNVAHLLGQRIETMLGQLPAKSGRRWLAWAKPRDRPRAHHIRGSGTRMLGS